MANTYELIASNTLTSTASSVTFSGIPNTYTDLVVRLSARMTSAQLYDSVKITLNNVTTTLYSVVRIGTQGFTAVTSFAQANRANFSTGWATASTATSNTFGFTEIYIPSYTANQNKPLSAIGHSENNATNAAADITAHLFRSTSPIDTITLAGFSANFVSGSSFFLYGIKNS